ncbi:hypothetical protein [Paraclostridium bifermentans]|uniref:hypothetical protein n=1 Tax=Paraclostridium bifermentans TaxID=1490 RepID=UPI0024BB95DD|nr:hypothetical protein [Paraclostridium bifermentans]
MFREYKNPFDREDIFKDKVKILVKLDTFEIIRDEEKDIIERLILLERLGCFRVLFILSEKEELNQIVKNNDGEVVNYYDEERYRPMIVMKTNKSDISEGLIYGTYDYFKGTKQSNGKSNISVLESFLIDKLRVDYVVTHNKDIYFNNEKKVKNIDLNTLIDEIRILLVNRGIYNQYTNSTVNQGLYYQHRITSVFTYYSILRYYTGELDNKKYGEVKEQTYSLAQRLIFLCKASDKISYYSLKKQGNDNRDECLYNFAYFIMLATGIFDDFAWILNRLYFLELKDMDIKLRCVYKNNEFLTSKFMKKLANKNEELSGILKNSDIQNDINILYPIRDTLQHRAFITAMGSMKVVGNRTIDGESTITIPKECIEFIKNSNIGTAEQWGATFEIGDMYCINPQLFTEKILYLINKISKCIVEGIAWSEFLNNEELNKIEIEIDKLKSGELKTWTFANDTLYFGRINLIEGNNV